MGFLLFRILLDVTMIHFGRLGVWAAFSLRDYGARSAFEVSDKSDEDGIELKYTS